MFIAPLILSVFAFASIIKNNGFEDNTCVHLQTCDSPNITEWTASHTTPNSTDPVAIQLVNSSTTPSHTGSWSLSLGSARQAYQISQNLALSGNSTYKLTFYTRDSASCNTRTKTGFVQVIPFGLDRQSFAIPANSPWNLNTYMVNGANIAQSLVFGSDSAGQCGFLLDSISLDPINCECKCISNRIACKQPSETAVPSSVQDQDVPTKNVQLYEIFGSLVAAIAVLQGAGIGLYCYYRRNNQLKSSRPDSLIKQVGHVDPHFNFEQIDRVQPIYMDAPHFSRHSNITRPPRALETAQDYSRLSFLDQKVSADPLVEKSTSRNSLDQFLSVVGLQRNSSHQSLQFPRPLSIYASTASLKSKGSVGSKASIKSVAKSLDIPPRSTSLVMQKEVG